MPSPFPYRSQLQMPVIGMEAEFKVFVDDREVAPEHHWKTPSAFIGGALLKRTRKSLQLPTGGVVYFDGGVIEVVTPVIEIAPACTARVVRSLWEQIEFVRGQLDAWESRANERIRLEGFSSHFNVSFELPREERDRNRTVQKLALLLAKALPLPLIVIAENRLSTGIGVRPRRDRVEVTLDFTPDPGLMAATAALIVGVVRDIVSWPSYRPAALAARGVPTIEGVEPGRHPMRKGWVVRDYHFPQNPFATDPDAEIWPTSAGKLSLRQIALVTAEAFEQSIRAHADTASADLLFDVFRGAAPALVDFPGRPATYSDVGRAIPWRRIPSVAEKTLNRSRYEKVFLELGNRRRLMIDGELLTPVAVKGWYHSLFRTPSGEERLLSLDQILARGQWRE